MGNGEGGFSIENLPLLRLRTIFYRALPPSYPAPLLTPSTPASLDNLLPCPDDDDDDDEDAPRDSEVNDENKPVH